MRITILFKLRTLLHMDKMDLQHYLKHFLLTTSLLSIHKVADSVNFYHLYLYEFLLNF